MKSTVFKMCAASVALAAGFGAFMTMPEGRVLSEKEKMEVWGLGRECRICEVGGATCSDKNSSKLNTECTEEDAKTVFEKNGKKGRIWTCDSVEDPSRRKSGEDGPDSADITVTSTSCTGRMAKCQKEYGEPNPNSGWQPKRDKYMWRQEGKAKKEGCGTLSVCVAENPKVNDPACKKINPQRF